MAKNEQKLINLILWTESLKYWNRPLKQEKHPYKWFKIKYNSINSGTSESILWSNSNIQMWSINNKDWKTGYVIKTGPTEKFL